MSYGKLPHASRCSHTVDQVVGSSSSSMGVDSDSEDSRRIDGREEDFELSDLSHVPSGSTAQERDFDLGFEDWESEGEKDGKFRKTRRASASTVQSFMLYTPDEERTVIKKFDRRLVLFVALLYMLSFLDRSSTY